VRRLEGLRCRLCDAPTNDWHAEQWRCVRCPHVENRAREGFTHADPRHCPFCNP
jgi:rubrerythrin